MKKVLFFTLEMQGMQEVTQLELANEYVAKGDEVLYITCGSSLGFCNDNRKGNHLQCVCCKKRQQLRTKRMLKGNYQMQCIDRYMTPDVWDEATRQTFHFSNMDELKAVRFENIEIGYGALSSYITYTRNIDADVSTDVIHSYLEDLLRMQVRMILAFKKIIGEFTPDLLMFHNGRFAEYKPLLGLARNMNIEFLCSEGLFGSDGSWCFDVYPNGTPHSVKDRDMRIKEVWSLNTDTQERERIARSFFENRRHARKAGDTIYTKDQKAGLMPDGWDDTKENIVIFNSSEDEFFAIGSDCGAKSIFVNQLSGIKAIAEHYQHDKNKHFTLRVHPHLKGLPYSYHQELYKLKYDNLTVIPADSAVSSYALMDGAEKIIVFGSTMGVESCYWEKPVINLAYAMYNLMDVVYIPESQEELWHMIDDKNLAPKNPDNALPYGYYFMTSKRPSMRYTKSMEKMTVLRLFGNKYMYHPGYRLLGSEHLYGIWRSFMYRYEGKIPGLSKYKEIPLK